MKKNSKIILIIVAIVVVILAVFLIAINSGLFTSKGTAALSLTSSPTIKVTSPNGGENWALGSTQKITWTSSVADTDDIMVIGADGSSILPAQMIKVTAGTPNSFSWVVGQTLGVNTNMKPGQYKVEVYSRGYPIKDLSDNYFNVR